MEFKARKVLIDPARPFENDCLSRSGDVENLSLLLRNMTSPIVMSVNAPWGHGKTTFLEMLHADLKLNNCKSVFFSAWETDFASDPLLAFLGEINQEIKRLINGDKVKNKAWESAKKAGVHILKKGIPALVKLGTAGVIDAEKILGDEAANLSESLSKDLIDEYSKNKSAIVEFKENLKKILACETGESENLYIFVDELDRCRPTYAIELLERIKHLLDVDGLVFILAMDKEQLSHSVKAIYGNDFESKGYLKRFIDIEYELPNSELDAFIDKFYKRFGFDQFFEKRKKYRAFQYDYDHLKNVFKLIAKAKSYSLREIEQLIARINLVIHSTNENTYIYPALLTFLITAKDSSSELYRDFINPSSTPERAIDYLYSIVPEQERLESFECALIEGFLLAAKSSHFRANLGDCLDKHKRNLKDEKCEEKLRHYSDRVVRIAQRPVEDDNSVALDSLISRIELSDKFKFGGDES
ncbi:KAP family P-loop NTPase fold protein [Rheinheimera sp. EpRS3]|uniref:KAP family P-loop NTPase fold protein n=1 Tax=Rheinheimera sp. EpRS3 TaxID=1712383 RepID=UPI000749C5A7|nr:P-loop NTPase fold protein [Rheinheimera sp. EpRS3]KUM54090.1 NTPase [Rheinheimera sp. EpRS3]